MTRRWSVGSNYTCDNVIVMTPRPIETSLINSSWPLPDGGWPENIAMVPYEYSAAPAASDPPSWLDGSNCQRFAYGVLALFGIIFPPLHSSDLWEECEVTEVTLTPKPLDLILFNSTHDSYGAHVGVWMSNTEILHLCQEVGRPASWSLDDFALRPRYATVIGSKRVINY